MRAILLSLLPISIISSPAVGILYNVNFVQSAQAQAAVAQLGTPLTTETVLRSGGALTLDDVYQRYNLSGRLDNEIYGAQPALGFYCTYARRPTDPLPPPAPDCVNVSATLRAHAAALVGAGIDYIVMDLTNWPSFDNATYDVNGSDSRGSLLVDATVVRPFEILFEEWAALRSAGQPTPSIAAWPCAPSPARVPVSMAMWNYVLDAFYNSPSYEGLIHRSDEGKKVFFMAPKPGAKGVQCFGNDTLALIEDNGGRHDVAVTQMWAQMPSSAYDAGVWGFFSPCTLNGTYTSSVVDAGSCDQFPTLGQNNTIAEITASTGYMLAASGLPYGQPGHLRGLTLARQFEAVLAAGAPNLLVSSFNEHTGGRVNYTGATGPNVKFNMGLPQDSQRGLVWVDAYAAEFNRNLEPTVEGGSRPWEVLTACIALYKAGMTCKSASPDNACCSRADKEVFSSVWSLSLRGDADHAITASKTERDGWIAAGWHEICAPFPNPTTFCVNEALLDGRTSPFIIYNAPNISSLAPTRPLLRCVDAITGAHSFTTSSGGCEADGGGRDDGIIGHVASVPGGEMLRALRRCRVNPDSGNSSTSRMHALDLHCDHPDGDAILGYVR